MHRLQELVRLHRLGTGVRERARLLKMSTRTERAYRQALIAAELWDGSVESLPDLAELKAAVEAAKPVPTRRSTNSSADRWGSQVEAAVKKGLGPKALWDRLSHEDPSFDVSLSSLKRAFQRVRRAHGPRAQDIAIPVETAPGEVAQVDFGYVGKLFDPQTGKIRKAWVFAMVLGHSRHMYAELVFDQKTTTWLELHVAAFRFFGGVVRTVVPDNLKAAVVRAAFGAADRHQIALNRSYRELARHYGFKVDPTPVYSPQMKGKVESAVKYIKGNFFAARDFESIDEAKEALAAWLEHTAARRHHRAIGCQPIEVFAEERGQLLPLPPVAYEPVVWKKATVHADVHFEFDRRLYSVPWRLVGQKVWVRATPTSVYAYADDTRVAAHPRRGPGRRSTQEEHLPEHRRDLRFRSADWWQQRAEHLGEPVATYVREVFESDDVLSKLRDVQAIVTLLEGYPAHRAHAACRRASFYANYSYQGIKRILVQGLDLQPLPTVVVQQHGHLTQPRFARSVSELLAPTLEYDHEPH